jgi:hypothetical protein
MVILGLKHHVDLNAPLHSNWARFLKTTNQSVIGKQHVNLLEQSTTLEKTLEDIQININTQVLETKYLLNLLGTTFEDCTKHQVINF